MLSTLVELAAALTVPAQTQPFSGRTLLKHGLNGDYYLPAEVTTHGSVDIQPCSEGAANQDWVFSDGQMTIFNGTHWQCLDVIPGID